MRSPTASPAFNGQDAEKVRPLRSRIVQTLNVPKRTRLATSLAAASLDGLFEHPACPILIALGARAIDDQARRNSFFHSLLTGILPDDFHCNR
jgi:hypothetical protein